MSSPTTDTLPTTAHWDKVGSRLIGEFPQFTVADVITEVVQAHDAADYVGTPEDERREVVELMARFALKVRDGQIVPSDRLDPERHASPHRQQAAG